MLTARAAGGVRTGHVTTPPRPGRSTRAQPPTHLLQYLNVRFEADAVRGARAAQASAGEVERDSAQRRLELGDDIAPDERPGGSPDEQDRRPAAGVDVVENAPAPGQFTATTIFPPAWPASMTR